MVELDARNVRIPNEPGVALRGTTRCVVHSRVDILMCVDIGTQVPGVIDDARTAALPARFSCVKPPLERLLPPNAGGSGTCAGIFDYDFNAWIATGVDPALVGGATVDGQFWFRDPSSPSTTGLSGGVEFVLCN